MKIIVMIDKANGNESVGTMWTETFLFEETATLKDVLNAIAEPLPFKQEPTVIKNNVRLQISREVLNKPEDGK